MGNHSASWVRGRLLAVALGTLALAPVGCGGKSKQVQNPSEVKGDTTAQVPEVDPSLCEAEGKDVESYDLNGDDKPDVWKLFKLQKDSSGGTSRILTCKQADLNFDGKKDYVVAFNDQGGILFEKFDFDFQKGFDAFYKYEEIEGEKAKSALYEVQRDSNFDGKYDIVEKYDTKTGQLTEVQRDTNGDLKPDVWEQYDKGQLVAILYDDAPYDGKVDRREEIKKDDEENKPDDANKVPAGQEGAAPADGGDSAAAGDEPASK